MELFTLGIGNYTEDDIKEAARAFTGWRRRRRRLRLPQVRLTTTARKTFFGHTGNFDGDDVIDIILAHPACAQYIAGKLFRFFAYEDAEPASRWSRIPESLGRCCATSGSFVRCCGRSCGARRSTATRAIGVQIKSPVQLVRRHRPPARASTAAAEQSLRNALAADGPGAVQAAERQRLARRPHVDQHQHAVRALQHLRRPRRRSTAPGSAAPASAAAAARGCQKMRLRRSSSTPTRRGHRRAGRRPLARAADPAAGRRRTKRQALVESLGGRPVDETPIGPDGAADRLDARVPAVLSVARAERRDAMQDHLSTRRVFLQTRPDAAGRRRRRCRRSWIRP